MRLLYLNPNGGQIQDLGVSIGSAIADNFLILVFSFLLILAPLMLFHRRRIRNKKLHSKNG
ncbi:hypothetical protein [Salegentibacter salarius]|uniref:Uncharacterized protein n=1 Tax=Salegentibacter salarius TaxID=435906 RepID=A0A2N0TVC4_9FLAO|nr:hypothetical protein [Salegentibacter salarius]OEY72506.1 hypothetical protein BHS39_12995 [Salegentibacter salarius]PKD18712.1 hypothetical protein APR40_12960 [Salegentibacter salarius]SLK02727.1 hypothetical protein SAMN05660445_02658 [Salegentibacter salarius]